jgi:hypothetical protein
MMIRRGDMLPSFTPDSGKHEVTFIADAMLGRLARWLRFLGFDTTYFPGISDRKLIRIALEQDRAILTRDTRLVEIRGLKKYLLIASDDPFQQLLETINAFNLRRFQLLSRCVACNGGLQTIGDKAEVKDSVPEYVYLHYSLFMKCGGCGKIYWEGTHPRKFREEVGNILGVIDKGTMK